MKDYSKRSKIISVFGGRVASDEQYQKAEKLGTEIAKNNWVLLCGGKNGIMEAVSKGCAEAGGSVIGILPGTDGSEANQYLGIAIATGIGLARNEILACACDAAVAVGGRYGTLSEIGHALQYNKPLVSLDSWEIEGAFMTLNVCDAINYLKEQLDED